MPSLSQDPEQMPSHNGGSLADEFTVSRKYLILFVVSWMTLVVTFSSTSLLTASPEIARDLSTTLEMIDVTNCGVLVSMGISALIWSPLSDLFGRRKIYNSAIIVMFISSVGSALAHSMITFVTLRILGGLTGTYCMVAGQTIIAEIFEPTVRGRATGFFMVGSVAGPAIGPCIGGIVVTFRSWRVIYWLQTAMSGLGLVMAILVIPKDNSEIEVEDGKQALTWHRALSRFNPLRVIKQYIRLEVLLSDLACGLLAITMYGLLTCVRIIINPRFNFTTPLISGLFYIAPGIGFFIGSVAGGGLSDRTVKNYTVKRGGVRLARDRLNSGLMGLFLILPISLSLLGWGLQKEFGGLALPIVAAFWVGIGITGTFNALNTYTAEVCPSEKAEVICSKYVVQYAMGAASTAAIVPLIDAAGVGWSFMCFTFLDVLAGILVLVLAKNGLGKNW